MNKTSHRLWFALVAFFLLAPSRADAQVHRGTLQGQVKDQEGNPLKDIVVRIEGLNGKQTYELKTDKRGRYFHIAVDPYLAYRIVVIKEGYWTEESVGVRASRKQSGGINNFTMRPGRSTAAEMTQAARDALVRELKQADEVKRKVKAIDESHKVAMRMIGEGRYAEAEKAFRRVVELQPTLAPTWGNLGHVYTKLNRPSDAVAAYRKAIELDPENATFYQDLGHVYSDMGEAGKARELYRKGAELTGSQDPKEAAQSQYIIAVDHLNSGRESEAMEALRQTLAADPEHADAHYYVGVLLIRENRMKEALDHLGRHLEMSPESPTAADARALLEALRQTPEAAE